MSIPLFSKWLQELHQESDEISASALVSIDGIMLASQLPSDVGEDRLAAMSAAMLSLAQKMVSDLSHTTIDRVMIQSQVGYVIVTAVSESLLLTVVTHQVANLGMVFHDIQNIAKKLQVISLTESQFIKPVVDKDNYEQYFTPHA